MHQKQKVAKQTGKMNSIVTGTDPSKGEFMIFVGTYQHQIIFEKTKQVMCLTDEPNPITDIEISQNCRYLLYATGYDWRHEEEERKEVGIVIKESKIGY